VAVLVRGDREVNETKVKRFLGCTELEMADEEVIRSVTGAPVGFAGPLGLARGDSLPLLADHEIRWMRDAVTGGNEADTHYVHVDPGRDFQVSHYGDFRNAVSGDPCPRCTEGTLEIWRGIEVGHIFKLGTKYSEAMGATFQDENGRERPMIMGCYGIGIERTVAAAIEQNHDKDGIIFPMAIAPYHVLVLCIQTDNPQVSSTAERLYWQLMEAGVEVLLDDRDERPGKKFKDADLIGIPLRINVGERILKEGKVELRHRATGEVEKWPVDQVCQRVEEIVRDQTQRDPGSNRRI
jgi:prolyl-tRNA synthetase